MTIGERGGRKATDSVAVVTSRASASAPRIVNVASAVLESLQATMARAMPREGVAVLGGRHTAGGLIELSRFVAVTNTADAPDRFEIAPIEFLRAVHAIERAGARLLGFAHSHPHGTTAPSSLDLARAWPHHLQMIFAPDDLGGCAVAAHWPQRERRGFTTLTIRPSHTATPADGAPMARNSSR